MRFLRAKRGLGDTSYSDVGGVLLSTMVCVRALEDGQFEYRASHVRLEAREDEARDVFKPHLLPLGNLIIVSPRRLRDDLLRGFVLGPGTAWPQTRVAEFLKSQGMLIQAVPAAQDLQQRTGLQVPEDLANQLFYLLEVFNIPPKYAVSLYNTLLDMTQTQEESGDGDGDDVAEKKGNLVEAVFEAICKLQPSRHSEQRVYSALCSPLWKEVLARVSIKAYNDLWHCHFSDWYFHPIPLSCAVSALRCDRYAELHAGKSIWGSEHSETADSKKGWITTSLRRPRKLATTASRPQRKSQPAMKTAETLTITKTADWRSSCI